MEPTSIQLSLSQAKADPSIVWARVQFASALPNRPRLKVDVNELYS